MQFLLSFLDICMQNINPKKYGANDERFLRYGWLKVWRANTFDRECMYTKFPMGVFHSEIQRSYVLGPKNIACNPFPTQPKPGKMIPFKKKTYRPYL